MTTKGFSGRYVYDVVEFCNVVVISKQQGMLIGAPGMGKTVVATTFLKQTGLNRVFVRYDSSTPPERNTGLPDPAAALESPPRIVYNTDGTPYQLGLEAGVLDEFGRAPETVWDQFIDILDRQDIPKCDQPVFIGTSNFMPESERQVAMIDRIALWMWVRPGRINWAEASLAALDTLNTEKEVDAPTASNLRNVWAMSPGINAKKAVSTIVDTLAVEATKSRFVPNLRSVNQWSSILFRVSAFHYGKDDFNVCHPRATAALRYAWPCLTEQVADEWADVAGSVGDPVGTAIDKVMGDTIDYVRQATSSKSTDADRMALVTELAKFLGVKGNELKALGADDPRVKYALTRINNMIAQVAQGDDPLKMEA